MLVNPGGLSQSGAWSPATMSLASSAAEAVRAAASARATRSSISDSDDAGPVTTPAAVPPATGAWDTTVTWQPFMTPLVVRVLLAQRRLADEVYLRMTEQLSVWLVSSACSTSTWGVV